MAKRLDTASFYRRIIRDAWLVAWHHKQLWIFGFFATLIGFGGALEVFFSGFERMVHTLPSSAAAGLDGLLPGLGTVKLLVQYSSFPAAAIALFALGGLLLAAIFTWMTLVSVGALVSDTRKIARGGEPTFADGVKAGAEHFWPVFGVNAAAKAVTAVALVVTTSNLRTLLDTGSWHGMLTYVGSYVALAVIAFFAEMTAVFATIDVVVKGDRPRDAAEKAWKTARRHWLVLLETSLFLALCGVGVALVAALVVLMLSVPVLFMIALASLLQSAAAVYSLIGLTAALLIAGAAVTGALVTTITVAAWTLLWSEIADRSPAALVHRIVHRLRRRK